MTSTARTSQRDLVAFIDFLADKGIMNTQTAAGRKSAVNTLLSALDPNETADVTPLDLDEVSKRFMNKRGSAFKPDSVKIYKARVASAIQDFLKYKADPLNFKVGITSKPTTITRTEKNAPAQANLSLSTTPPQVHSSAHHQVFVSPSEIEIVVPIPIRPNTIVKIVGLPSDLTKQEAAKLANIIQAFAIVDDAKGD
jgi:hypothetical protein